MSPEQAAMKEVVFIGVPWSENTLFFINFMYIMPEHDEILPILVHWCRFLIKRKISQAKSTYFKSEIGQAFQ